MKLSSVIPAVLMIICLAACKPVQEYTFVQYNVGAFSKYDSSSVEAIARAVREMNADAVTLNELDSCTTRTGQVDQLAAFAQEMGGWNHHYAAAMPYKGGAYGVGVAASPAFEVVRIDRIALPKLNGREPRAVAVVEYKDYVLCSTHLDLTLESQLGQVETINHYMDSVYADSRKPIFLCGDFNCLPDSEPIKVMKQTWQQISPSLPTYPADSPVKCIDYIFVRPNGRTVTVKTTSIPQTLETADLATASDHLPVVATVTIKRLHP